MRNRQFTVFYVVICCFALVGAGLRHWADWDLLHHISKPLPALSLAFFFFWDQKKQLGWEVILMTIALLFSFLGDSFLMYEGETWFILGLSSFFVTHIAYSVLFAKQGGSYLKERWWIILMLVAYGIGFIYCLKYFMGGTQKEAFLIPISAYAIAIVLMALTAINRYRNISDSSYQWVLIGALLFIISDSLIGINKFVIELPTHGIGVLLTYYIAQYCITLGYLDSLHAKEYFDS